ncbi:MAG TPA: MmcQ/YjbR family DNA-binding protein [Myxococcaceae bacterium]
MAGSNPLTEMRRICLALPEATETMTWGQPHFRVRGKIFAGIGDHAGIENIGFKLEREHADAVIQDPRFYRAPYVGAHGWVSMRVEGVRDWGEVRALVLESYRLIAPKALWAMAQGGETPARPKAKAPARRRSGKRPAASRSRKRSPAARR